MRRPLIALAALAISLSAVPLTTTPVEAFCGFYVSGGDAELFNDATQVALMRDGTKTVLSMQNNYRGPAKAFAMVVPVPVVLSEDDVKTLPNDLFKRLDAYSAPRLVEYWELDPCYEPPTYENNDWWGSADMSSFADMASSNNTTPPEPVVIEAQFSVGEYDIVILSATEASGLETWLKDNQYNIPEGAAPIFRSYIQQGMYFFVAKIDPAKVTYDQGEAVLSPLRFSYTSEDFSLPIRLGLVNSQGTQDLIITTLGSSRFEAANYPNATIPTNVEVDTAVKTSFGGFYTQLFEQTVAKNPGAVVTEYAWDLAPKALQCDPCPPLASGVTPEDLMTLGADVLGGQAAATNRTWTFTRLHMRYGAGGVEEDITFRAASPLVGGRERYTDSGMIEPTQQGATNEFQGRYIMRNRWTGAIACDNPKRGVWGGPPSGGLNAPSVATGPNQSGTPAPLTLPLDQLIRQDVPELGVTTTNPIPGGSGTGGGGVVSGEPSGDGGGCANTAGGGAPVGLGLLAALGLALGVRRREG